MVKSKHVHLQLEKAHNITARATEQKLVKVRR